MRSFVAAAVASLLIVGASAASEADASIKRFTRIEAQGLEPALKALARDRELQLVYRSEVVGSMRTAGISGEMTADEALTSLLSGTGLTYRYLDEKTVTIVPLAAQPAKSGDDAASRSASTERMPSAAVQKDWTPAVRFAQAQAAPSTPAPSSESSSFEGEGLEEITVRGKPFTDANVDIVRTEYDAQPYYIYKSEDIEKANVSNLEDFLNQRLTMNNSVGTASQVASNGGGSYSRVNLRGVGVDHTLILLNGHRVAGAGSSGRGPQQFDLNTLSPALIDRIEILPSSASAIYGGNALGGVVNVILKRTFTGGVIQAGYDTPLDENAPIRSASGVYGWSLEGGRTNITVSASFRDNESLLQGDRSRLIEAGYRRVLATSPGLLYSPNFPYFYGGTTPNVASADGSNLLLRDGTSLGSSLTYIPSGITGTTPPSVLDAGLLANAGQQNTAFEGTAGYLAGDLRALSKIGRQRSALVSAQREMTDRLDVFAEFFHDDNDSSKGPSQSIFPYYIPAGTPTNPFLQDVFVTAALPIARRYNDFSQSSERALAGFVLDLPRDWRAEGDYTWMRTKSRNKNGQIFDVTGDLADGTLNPFVAAPDVTSYLASAVTLRYADASTLRDVALRVSGPVATLPAGQANLTIGIARRKEAQPWGYQDLGPYGLTTYLPQSQRVSSAYAEGLLPLVAPANAVPGIRLLDFQVAARLERYSVSAGSRSMTTFPPDYAPDPDQELLQTTTSYNAFNKTFGFRYKPVDSLMFRASFSTAFLPPGYADFLTMEHPAIQGYPVFDPQRGNLLETVAYSEGGNPDIKPEHAKDWNVGLVFQPTFLERLRVGVEWFRISRNNLIYAPEIQAIVSNPSLYPGRVTRAAPAPGDPYTVGPIVHVDATEINAAHVETEGVDFTAGYAWPTGRLDTFSLDFQGTRVSKFSQQVALDIPAAEVTNETHNGGPLKVRANATLGWQRGPWSADWTAMYYGSYDIYAGYDDPLSVAAQGGTSVPRQIYHNLLLGYQFGSTQESAGVNRALSGLTVRLGMRNVFDKTPPFDVVAFPAYYSPWETLASAACNCWSKSAFES